MPAQLRLPRTKDASDVSTLQVSQFWREGLLDQCLNTIQRVEPSVWIQDRIGIACDDAAADVLKPALDTIENDTVAEY